MERERVVPNFPPDLIQRTALRLFLKMCLVSSGYSPPDALGKAIHLASAGQAWVPRIQEGISEISLAEIKVALFLKDSADEGLVDYTNTDSEAIRAVIDAEIISGNIRYPWVYDRLLYDRFFETFAHRTEELSYEDTMKLLKGTPQGVFQLGDVLVGPFGILNSACHRLLRPTRRVLLWHCSDSSCFALHPVRLCSGENRVSAALSFVLSTVNKKMPETTSELEILLPAGVGERDFFYDDMNTVRLPWLLVNAFSEGELRTIFAELINQNSEEIRHRFPQRKQFRGILSGSAEQISSRLTKAQCFQFILLTSDEAIIRCVDYLIEKGHINVPATEIRTPVMVLEEFSWLDVSCECSRFGIRFITRKVDVALARLRVLIQGIYKQGSELADLQWKLRHFDGQTIYEKLDMCLHTEDPRHIVGDLLFDSPSHINRAIEFLRYGWFAWPSSPEEERHFVEKLLWKLGFDIGLYPPYQSLFWERFDKFLDTVRNCVPYDEHYRESVRSAGVNFFVSLEEILDYGLSFIAWALLSDHYGVTKFRFNLDVAREFMALHLSGRKQISGKPLEFDPAGTNTLYPLVKGFAILAELCMDLAQARTDNLVRDEGEFPSYYWNTEIAVFPFRHKALFLDLRAVDRDNLIGLLKEVTAELERSQVCSIRNRIDHRSTDFPRSDEIERACDIVARTVNRMEATGICPLVYLSNTEASDEYRRSSVRCKDYRSREIVVRQPSQHFLCNLPPISKPQVIVPLVRIGDSSEMLRFEFEENSDYVRMWRGYPRRIFRPSSEEQVE